MASHTCSHFWTSHIPPFYRVVAYTYLRRLRPPVSQRSCRPGWIPSFSLTLVYPTWELCNEWTTHQSLCKYVRMRSTACQGHGTRAVPTHQGSGEGQYGQDHMLPLPGWCRCARSPVGPGGSPPSSIPRAPAGKGCVLASNASTTEPSLNCLPLRPQVDTRQVRETNAHCCR